MAWCVMVKGPCRGNMCDFWARVRIRKRTESDLAREIQESITTCQDQAGLPTLGALREYWSIFGVRDMERLCMEEPELCEKIRRVEELAFS